MLVGRDLTVRRGPIMALQGVSLELRPGQVFGVLGPNGAGKSTLLATLSGELRPSRGQVLLQGRPLGDWADVERARCLAVLPQSSTLSFAFRVADVVAMGRLPHRTGRDADATIVAAALAAADAQHLAARSYLELSGGERQRVHLARVLAQLWPGEAGQVLMLDEPTSMLDPAHQHGILKAVRAFAAQGAAALVILHDLNLAARYCDRLLLLRDGRPIVAGSPAEVLRAEPLRAVFGLDVLVQRHPELGHPLIIAR
ncbi:MULTISPECIES: heme ABC transporter ATP-binding protein [Stutzerimonas stutzeri subgroup]|jgi:iron complex transport system ATP-binding protein|uniref:Hemin importer ATP-binding subunit n=1 Tax=Stutzerimonas stutzeri NF13 TaxID=1212548 RepID=M2VFG2_STUST|nr:MULTISPECIES: heme ABC transporter ATP-binding protein [Stutzerimonas stutzeri subgroup]EMD98388.1 hemin importer ATP-binding subunit [Stutzerimonas stutzeri NF13]MBK3880087.1 heme ABC transporter ATP-binding protein [Stutzerimonas stutzeri]MCQ4293669.1 heme ABC transporter ATP-binding protein [Stutzerimonas stutzeri]WOF78039.1 heme ABC transporter ATP-binding protein [Pseudomonas sp. FeN3W]